MARRAKRGLAATVLTPLVAHPATTGGALLMAAMATAIIVNALTMQSGRHPSPLFGPGFDTSETGSIAPVEIYDREVVSAIQQGLADAGVYDGAIDGMAGPQTRSAVERYERLSGLTPTGVPNEEFLDLMHATEEAARIMSAPLAAPVAPAATPAPSSVPLPRPRPGAALQPLVQPVAMTGARLPPAEIPAAPAPDPRVARVQELLDILGYGPVAASGQLDEATRAAIRRFEANRGIVVTGEVSDSFIAELRAVGAPDFL